MIEQWPVFVSISLTHQSICICHCDLKNMKTKDISSAVVSQHVNYSVWMNFFFISFCALTILLIAPRVVEKCLGSTTAPILKTHSINWSYREWVKCVFIFGYFLLNSKYTRCCFVITITIIAPVSITYWKRWPKGLLSLTMHHSCCD